VLTRSLEPHECVYFVGPGDRYEVSLVAKNNLGKSDTVSQVAQLSTSPNRIDTTGGTRTEFDG